jgi:hypothetical protein
MEVDDELEMPLSMVLFDGLKGQVLPHVVKMTVWVLNKEAVRGIGFTFDRLLEGRTSQVLGLNELSTEGKEKGSLNIEALDF